MKFDHLPGAEFPDPGDWSFGDFARYFHHMVNGHGEPSSDALVLGMALGYMMRLKGSPYEAK